MEDAATILIAFARHDRIGRGPVREVVLAAKARLDAGETGRIAIFDDATGQAIDVDFRGTPDEVLGRLEDHPLLGPSAQSRKRGPGRPRLGVVSREVSLLPRHWDWLGDQKGGASAALRRLVDQARQGDDRAGQVRRAAEATHRFLWDIAGDLPGFEEATRSLQRGDHEAFQERVAPWPPDVREHVLRLAERQRGHTTE